MENITSLLSLVNFASDGSTLNLADCDSGAQDMFGDSLSLNELRKAYPELYLFMCQRDPSFEETDITETKKEVSWSKLGNSLKDQDFDHGSDVAQLLKESNSVMSILTIRKAMSSIFECLNTVHVQKTLKLRLEIRDLCCRLQSLQTSREMDQREIYRLQRENDRCRRELAQQASRYEDRITELHGVLEELKRKASEMQASALIPTVGVDDLVQISDSDGEHDVPDATNVCASQESMLQPSTSQDGRPAFPARRTVRHEPWMMGCVRQAASIQSDTVVTSRQIDLTSTAASTSGILTEARSQGKPVMGLRQHNQTRKPRILSQAQLSQSSNAGGNRSGNWSQGEGNVQSAHFSQPTSEFSLHFDDGLSKISSASDDHIRQPHSSALSDSTSSVTQSCCSGENISGGEIAVARGGAGGERDETEPQWVRHSINCCVGASGICGREGNAPTTEVVQTFLSGLAVEAPYPRLADMARYALLVCEQRDALCARHEAEVTVLEASLAETKAAGDQLRCRLGQIEASWGAATRAAELADMALETSGVLVHLYSSELALLLHKQPHTEGRSKLERSHHGRSLRRLPPAEFSSTSTSSSSSDEDEIQRLQRAPSASRVQVDCRHTVTNNGLSQQAHPPTATNENGNNVYAVYAANGKPSDESSHLSLPTWIPPHAACEGPACLRLLKMQRHQTEVTALHLLSRFSYVLESFLKPESPVSAAVEDFTPNTTNGNRSTITGTESGLGAESGGSSLGTGVHGVYANAWCIAARPFSSTRQAYIPCGGWQTPDSGAGSFSTNDHATNVTAGLVGISDMLNTHTCNSHSSNSSSSSSGAAAAAAVVGPASGTGASTASAEMRDDSGWTRVKEMKLRHILDQIIWERMLVRSTVAVNINHFEAEFSAALQSGELQYMKPYDGSELLSYNEGGNMRTATQESKEPVISNRLNALFMVETAALLQDLCAVKEDRARLKVQNYIMEKELRAIQLSHQGHCLSEFTLRSQLKALQIDRNIQMHRTPERCGGHNSFAQQFESLQSAFESIRKSSEQHQSQSEELVNDLKQANAALITAFEKAKSKYLARIRKLESEIAAPSSTPMLSRPAAPSAAAATKRVITLRPPTVPAHKAAHLQHPLPPVPLASTSDVYEVIQDSHVGPAANLLNSNQLPIGLVTSKDTGSQNGRYSMGPGAPCCPKHPLSTVNRAPPRPR